MKDKKQLVYSLALLFAAFLWGMSYSIQNTASQVGSYTVVFFRGIGGLLLIPVSKIFKQRFNKKTYIGGILIGLFAFLGCLLQQFAVETTTISKSSFICSLYIVLVPIMGLFLKKKPKLKVWIAILIASVGLYFLCMSGEFTINYGDLFALGSSFCFALQIVLIDIFASDVDPIPFTCVQQLAVAFFSSIVMVGVEKPQLSAIINLVWPLFYLAVISGALAQTIQNVSQKNLDPSVASIIMSFESVFGALGGWLLLNQTLSLKEIFGCILIFIAVIIAQ